MREIALKLININPMLMKVSKKDYMSLRLLIQKRWLALVSDIFVGSRMNRFHVVAELIIELCNSLYMMGSKPISAETLKLLILDPCKPTINASVQKFSRTNIAH